MTTELPRTPGADETRPVPRAGGDATQQVPVVVPRRLGDYELLERVGEGGMGVVWRAVDGSGREVAIKVLRPHIAHDEHARERLRREVRTLARVHHPRIADVIDADVDGPAPYIVTEFVPGPPLDKIVDRDGPLGGDALLRLARGLAEALQAIHDAGIVHRDLKPGNVLMVGQGDDLRPVVIDFGIAQVADDARLTSTGLVMGTPGYLSPEVVEGGEVSPATDWWGWAATLTYAASGQPPFGRGPLTVVLDRVARGRLQLDGVDPELRPVLAAALDPEPARRPTQEQLLDAIERYARHEDVTGALPGWAQDADVTSVHELAEQTRVAPQQRPGHPRAAAWPETAAPAPASPRRQVWADPAPEASGAQPAWREPAPMPEPREPQDPGWGAAQPQGGAHAYDLGQPDPRIGRSARTGTLAALLAVFVALAAVAPLAAWGLYAVWGLTARTVDRTLTGLVLRRHEAGRRASDVPVTVLAAPWHLLASTLATVLALLLPLAVAVVVALVFSGFVTSTELMVGIGPEHPLANGLGALIGGALGWWGLGSTSLRRGSRTLARGIFPPVVPRALLLAVCLGGAVALVGLAAAGGDYVSWWPLPPGTSPVDLLPFTLP